MTSIRIDIACNDPDNGLFGSCAHGISLPDGLAEFEACNWDRPPRFMEFKGSIRLAGKHWPVLSSKEWISNWCWNGYFFSLPVAVDFIVWLHSRHLFSVDQAEERLFNRWKVKTPFDDDDRKFVKRQLEKAALHARAT